MLTCTSKAGGKKVSFGSVHAPTDEKHVLLTVVDFTLLVANYINIKLAHSMDETDLVNKGKQWMETFKFHLKVLISDEEFTSTLPASQGIRSDAESVS